MGNEQSVNWPLVALGASAARDQALDALARRCGPRACTIARSFVRDATAAEDLVQEALVRTYERIDQLRDAAALDAWFFRVLTRLCLNSLRRGKRWHRFLSRNPPAASVAAAPSGDIGRLLAAVAALPDKQRLAIVLRYGSELSVREVASAMEVQPATAKTHLDRGMNRLRSLLGATDHD